MKRILSLISLFSIFTFAAPVLDSAPYESMGKISEIQGSGIVIVHSPKAGENIQMGDKLFVIIDGQPLVMEAIFPMMTSVKCRLIRKPGKKYANLQKGIPVYRYKPGIEKDFMEKVPDTNTDDTAGIFTGDSFTDSRDKKKYKVIKIGGQIWFAENLKFKSENSICYQSNEDFCSKNGRLYKWDSAMTGCPMGWHLPTEDEWTVLEKNYSNIKPLLQNESSKFDILMSGQCGSEGSCSGAGTNFYFWSATEFAEDTTRARLRWNLTTDNLQIATNFKTQYYSVRCLYDKK